MKFEVTGFLNGVPVINEKKKKNDVNELYITYNRDTYLIGKKAKKRKM